MDILITTAFLSLFIPYLYLSHFHCYCLCFNDVSVNTDKDIFGGTGGLSVGELEGFGFLKSRLSH